MEKANAAYETLFIVDLSLGDDGVRAMIDKFLGMIGEAGEISETAEWSKRHLAYPINDINEGYYVLVNYTAPAAVPAELERVFKITEGIMRSMTIRLGE